ncbi:MAG: hypothetical protein ABI091_01475 [Ferruginibacter sp.]
MKSTTIKYLFQRVFIMAIGLLMSIAVFADPSDTGPCNPGLPPDDPDNICPIDSWIYVLIVAVILIAIKKAYDAKKAKAISL